MPETVKAHLILSEMPLAFSGQSMSGLCGATVLRAEAVFSVDLSRRELQASQEHDCPVCICRAEGDPRLLDALGAPGWAGKRLYLYAIAAGREEQAARAWVERKGAA